MDETDGNIIIARLYSHTPEIDGNVIIENLGQGTFDYSDFLTVEITDAYEYDLIGRIVR